MKVYSKKLRSVADLERERRRLLKERAEIEEQGLLSMDDVIDSIGNSRMLGGKIPAIISIASRVAPLAGTFAAPLISVVQQWLSSPSAEDDADEKSISEKKTKTKETPSRAKSMAWALGKELIGSYLKWKAMELSYKGVKHIVKKQREKKATQQANGQQK